MTFTVGPLGLCCIATVILWVAIIAWPGPKSRGDYDFYAPIVALMFGGAGVIATLVIWLVYFALLR